MLMGVLRIMGLSWLMGMSVEVHRFPMPVQVKMDTIPKQTAQHIKPQQDQHESDRKFQSLGKVRWNQRVHHQHYAAEQK